MGFSLLPQYLNERNFMTAQTLDLIQMAEALPIDEKAFLVDRLLESMYPHDEEIDELWRIKLSVVSKKFVPARSKRYRAKRYSKR